VVLKTSVAVIDDEFRRQYTFGVPGTYAVVSVRDTGVGMDSDTRMRAFEPFFTTKETGKGTGLGLAIVYGIMKQNKGYITVESEPGSGTLFRLYFPLVTEAIEPERVAEPAPPSTGHETILVAEDDPSLRELTRIMLTEFGYSVIEAADGDDAVRKFREHGQEIKLAILDVVMPRMNGRQVRDEIIQMRPDIQVLFLSGYTADVLEQKGVVGDRANILLKPVSPMDLLRTVRRLIDGGASTQRFPPPSR
jgi:CheY-like chemotaxis protein